MVEILTPRAIFLMLDGFQQFFFSQHLQIREFPMVSEVRYLGSIVELLHLREFLPKLLKQGFHFLQGKGKKVMKRVLSHWKTREPQGNSTKQKRKFDSLTSLFFSVHKV